ncbi:MAG: ankyrin repeat domain-containing protein [Rickettsia endosymbiont of Haemaphysalis japonica]
MKTIYSQHSLLVSLAKFKLYYKKGVNLDEHKNARRETALHHTLFTGYMDRAKLLLEHNASPNIKDNYGQTILHKLISFNAIDKMEFLLQNATKMLLILI